MPSISPRFASLSLFALAAAGAVTSGCTSEPSIDDETGPAPACEHAPSPARSLRVFAVGHKLTLSEGATYASYASAFRMSVDRDVSPHLATDRPNVLVFPESVAFTAAFVGARGETARAKESAFLAYVALQAQMTEAFGHYRSLAQGAALGTWIMLAASDPTWRAFHDTFSAIAREHHAWVIASIDIGDTREAEPALADMLGDPERPTGGPVYEVPDGRVYNQAIIFAPTGELAGRLRKVYLTDPEHGELGITGHLPEQVVAELGGVARIAAMISRDAWMPDLQDRIAAAGTELVLQHEAFSTWTVPDPGAPWPADNLKRSGWAMVQKHPELRMTAAPMLAGNFFDIGFDGQTFIATPGTPDGPRRSLLAQDADTGWAAIAPWVAPEPATGSLSDKRAALRAIGEALAPGGTQAGGHVEGTVFADLDVPTDDGYTAVPAASADGAVLGPSVAIAPSGIGRQRAAAPVVLADGTLVVAWEDTRYCTGQIVVARSTDAGATWSEPARISPWPHAQHTPSLAALPDGALVAAWQEVLGDGDAEIRVATSRDGGATWTRRVRVDQLAMVDAWAPSLAVDPITRIVYLVFVDTRPVPPTDDGTEVGDAPDNRNRRVYLTRSLDAGATWAAPSRVDPRDRPGDQPDPTLSNEWAPRVVAHDSHVVVAYTHRERPDETEQPSWDAHVIESGNGGLTFTAPRRLDPGGFPERIAADTSLALDADGRWRAAFSTYRGTASDAELLLASPDADAAAIAQPSEQWWPSLTALPDGDFALTWQDFRSGGNDVYIARVTATGLGPALRVDDAGRSPAQAWRPRIAAAADGSVFVVWEDSRTGHAELRIAKGALP